MPIYTILLSYRPYPAQKMLLSPPLSSTQRWYGQQAETLISVMGYLAHTKPRNSCGERGHWEQGETEAAGAAPDSCPCCVTINPFRVADSFFCQKISKTSWPQHWDGRIASWWGWMRNQLKRFWVQTPNSPSLPVGILGKMAYLLMYLIQNAQSCKSDFRFISKVWWVWRTETWVSLSFASYLLLEVGICKHVIS